MKATRKIFYLTPLCALLAAGAAHATNGMLMEGYGPISTGMGGVSQAIDHGNAGMAQNPATLGMMAANVPAVLLGEAVTRVVPLKYVRMGAAAVFAILGAWVLLVTSKVL